MIKTLFPVCQIVIAFTAKVNKDEEGAMDTICNANEGAGRIAFRKQYIIFRQLLWLSALDRLQ